MASAVSITRRRALTSIGAFSACALPAISAVAAVPDPLLEAIETYRRGKAVFEAIPESVFTYDNEDYFRAQTYGPAQDLMLSSSSPKVTSLAGVREAIRLAFEEDALIDRVAENALRSALAYLDENT